MSRPHDPTDLPSDLQHLSPDSGPDPEPDLDPDPDPEPDPDPDDEVGEGLGDNDPGMGEAYRKTAVEPFEPSKKKKDSRKARYKDFYPQTEVARMLGLKRSVVKSWVYNDRIPGAINNSSGVKIPKSWVHNVLDGSIIAPDGINRKEAGEEAEIQSILQGGTPIMPKANSTTSRNQEVINRLQELYGQDHDIRCEVNRRGPAGYAFKEDLPRPPSKSELQDLYPEGGDFMLRIFRNGKMIDESSGIIVDPVDGTYDPSEIAPMKRRPPFKRPGPVGGDLPLPPPPSASDHLIKRAADVAFGTLERGGRGDGGATTAILQSVLESQKQTTEQINRQLAAEREARQEEARRADERERREREEYERRRREEKEDAEQRRLEEKQELEDALAMQRAEYEAKAKADLERTRLEIESIRQREKENFERSLQLEKERSQNLISSQQEFFKQMREIDNMRASINEQSRQESRELNDRMVAAQREAVDEQRRFNERMYNAQMEHLQTIKALQESSQPMTMLATVLDKGLEKIGPAIQERVASRGGTALAGPQQQGGQNMGIIDMIKSKPFFAEELVEVAMKVKSGITPAFTVNKMMGMMQMDPTLSIVLDYVVTRPIDQVISGVNLPGDIRETLSSDEAKEWWATFQRLLIQTMNMTLEQNQIPPGGGEAAAGGAGAGPGGDGSAGPGLNQGQV